MYFQLPTVNTSKYHDVHLKQVHETTKHKIATPARTVSGPAGCCLLFVVCCLLLVGCWLLLLVVVVVVVVVDLCLL